MRRWTPVVALMATALVVAACQDGAPPTSFDAPAEGFEAAPSFTITDGRAADGNEHFFFLPPLASDTVVNGAFNPKLAPVMVVCRLGGNAADPAGSTSTGECAEDILSVPGAVQLEDEQYMSNWKPTRDGGTDDILLFDEAQYRLRVQIGSVTLGFADVLFGENGDALKDAPAGFLGFVINQDLPVKYRIEDRALCSVDTPDCFEGLVGPEGGTFVASPLNEGGSVFPENAVADTVNLIIERIALAPGEVCIAGLTFQQFEGCYRYRTEPALAQFGTPVTVGICVENAALNLHDQLALFRIDDEDVGDPTASPEELPGAPFPDVLACDDVALNAIDNPLLRLAARGLRGVSRVIGPKPLFAGDEGFGGTTSRFSFIGWGRPIADPVIVAGDGQTALTGATLPVDPTVFIEALHGPSLASPATTPPGALAVPVTFTFTDPDDAVTGDPPVVVTVPTNAEGLASVSWTLSETVGTHTLVVSAPGVAPVTFTADAVPSTTPLVGSIALFSTRQASNFDVIFLDPNDASETQIFLDSNDESPSLSPDGSRVAWERGPSHDGDIWVMDVDGSNPAQLTAGAADDGDPQWSPDGSKITFVSDGDIWVMNADGTGAYLVEGDAAADLDPTWSPDGSKIAFASDRDGSFDLWYKNANGNGQAKKLVDASEDGADERHPDWFGVVGSNGQLDVSLIVYEGGKADIFVYDDNAKGNSTFASLVNGRSAQDGHPTWSPDGSQIAFASNRAGGFEVWVMDADGSHLSRLTFTSGKDLEPDWGVRQ